MSNFKPFSLVVLCSLPFIHAMFNIFFLAKNIYYNVNQIREANQSHWIIIINYYYYYYYYY